MERVLHLESSSESVIPPTTVPAAGAYLGRPHSGDSAFRRHERASPQRSRGDPLRCRVVGSRWFRLRMASRSDPKRHNNRRQPVQRRECGSTATVVMQRERDAPRARVRRCVLQTWFRPKRMRSRRSSLARCRSGLLWKLLELQPVQSRILSTILHTQPRGRSDLDRGDLVELARPRSLSRCTANYTESRPRAAQAATSARRLAASSLSL